MTTSYSNYPPPVKTFDDGGTFDKAAYAAYEAVKSERDALRESEETSKKRIEALEQETNNLLKSYQDIYEENRVLRSKLEHGPNSQKIRTFRNEINKLEDNVAMLRSQNELLTDELSSVQKQVNNVSDAKRRLDDAFKMERGLHVDKTSGLEKESNKLQEKIERLEQQQGEYERRVKNYDDESDGLLNRYKELKRDNMKMETKFKKQKNLIDEDMRDTKETNNEMAKEIIRLKTKLAKLQTEYHSVKLDWQASQKQIDYQNKELEVFKTQSSHMKRNVQVTTREYNSMKEELNSVEDMLIDTRNLGFENVIDDRRHMQRKERKQFQHIDGLEVQVDELTKENNHLEKEANECRQKLEASLLEHQNLIFANTAMKRRIAVLEHSNIELDRQTKFQFEKSKRGLIVTMPDENIKNLEREKYSLIGKCRALETHNRKLMRRVKELEHGTEIDTLGDMGVPHKYRRHSEYMIHAEMPSLFNRDLKTSYHRKERHVRSLPE